MSVNMMRMRTNGLPEAVLRFADQLGFQPEDTFPIIDDVHLLFRFGQQYGAQVIERARVFRP